MGLPLDCPRFSEGLVRFHPLKGASIIIASTMSITIFTIGRALRGETVHPARTAGATVQRRDKGVPTETDSRYVVNDGQQLSYG